MDVHASEKEQVEALKKWWKDNGSSIITGVLLGISILLGGKAWFSYQETQALSASNIYTQMMGAANNNDSELARKQATELIANYTGSAYAPLASLLLAKLAIEEGELAAAQAQLQWALDHSSSAELQHTARTRLVRVMIDQQQYEAAAQLLAAVGDAGVYRYLYTELEGDLAMAQNKPEQAASAYKKALDEMPAQTPGQGYLAAKYENVAGVFDTSQ
jgi:predicted negative regulator of RcsB-dependent stress response